MKKKYHNKKSSLLKMNKKVVSLKVVRKNYHQNLLKKRKNILKMFLKRKKSLLWNILVKTKRNLLLNIRKKKERNKKISIVIINVLQEPHLLVKFLLIQKRKKNQVHQMTFRNQNLLSILRKL